MTDDLRDLLRQDADNVEIPTFDASDVAGLGERQLRRRRASAVVAAVAAVAVVAVGSYAANSGRDRSTGPIDRPSKHDTHHSDGSGPVTRKILYYDHLTIDSPEGPTDTTVHYGDRVVDLDSDDWPFLDVTDDGFVYTDGNSDPSVDTDPTFTDGGRPVRIATGVCPDLAGFQGVQVQAANEGSLVAWFDCSAPAPADLVVFDTGLGREVARRPMPGCGVGPVCYSYAVIGDHVYFGDRMFDISTGQVRTVAQVHVPFHHGYSDLVAQSYLDDIRSHPRGLVIGDSWETGTPTPNGVGFTVVGTRLVPTASLGDAPPLTSAFDTATHRQVRLQVPAGYHGAGGFSLFEWLDDDTVALIGPTGWDDAPGYGDILTCRLSDGHCDLTTPGHGPVRVEANGGHAG